jgi:predicted permease
MAIFILMLLYLGMSFGLMAEETSKLRILFIVIALLLNIIILPLIATLSYVILQKSKLKIQSKLKNQLI